MNISKIILQTPKKIHVKTCDSAIVSCRPVALKSIQNQRAKRAIHPPSTRAAAAQLPQVISVMENSSKPIVAAVDGLALGGGQKRAGKTENRKLFWDKT